MRLKKFRVKNYRSIIDSGDIEISDDDNVLVLAGQNESGKSSLLRALYDYEEDAFPSDTTPFSSKGQKPQQVVSCTYAFEQGDNIAKILTDVIKSDKSNKMISNIDADERILDEDGIKGISEFTITKTKSDEGVLITIDEHCFKMFQLSILEKTTKSTAGEAWHAAAESQTNEKVVAQPAKKIIEITDEEKPEVAKWFWFCAPKIIFFDDFCDLLPDKIFISALKKEQDKTEGYRAVQNLEKIFDIAFSEKDNNPDSVRTVQQEEDNEKLSVTFRKDWGQKVHGENEVVVRYTFEKRESGSYVNFYVETKERQPLSPKQRSKGLIWFLSLWLELKAQGSEKDNLVILLDEPDQHLHIKAQHDILKLINKLAGSENESGKRGKQIFYATHSPYLIESDRLNRINLVVNDKKEGTKIESIASSKFNSKHKKDALLPIAHAMGLSASGIQAPSKPNVILEGISDFYYFSAMKKILGRTGDYVFVPSIGVRAINSLISMSIGYDLQWVAVIDDDPKNGGRESKEKFDELKDLLFNGDEVEAKKRIYVLAKSAGIEYMFTKDDLSRIGHIVNGDNMGKSVGRRRKELFARKFLEKVKSKQITEGNLSEQAKKGFSEIFDFIEKAFSEK